MSRECKFRAWHKKERKMYQVLAGSFFSGNNLFWIEVQDDKGKKARIDKQEDVEIMQSTNCRDKNGKEIYEGDIYEFKGGGAHLVKWQATEWCDRGFIGFDSHAPEDVEVVGNIYGTPDLARRAL